MTGPGDGAPALRGALRGWFARLLLPPIILQSVLIGGGYATGREIVEYGAKYGARGWWAVLAIFAGFTLMSILTFELARVFRAYDYKRFIRELIGPAWPLFDLLYGAMTTLVIAVMVSAAANIMRETLGLASLLGTALMVVGVGALLYLGPGIIEAFESVGTALLYAAYVVFGAVVLSRHWGNVEAIFAAGDTSYVSEAGVGAVLGTGILYVGYNLAVFPSVLFALHRQTTRRQTLVAGILAGLLMTLPFALTYLCLLAYYPDPAVLAAAVPWLRMLGEVDGGWLIAIFGIVMGWTLLETSVGMVHALFDRIELSRRQSGILGVGILAAAALLSRYGIIELVATGYTLMGYLFIALFGLPLATIGVVRIVRASTSNHSSNVRVAGTSPD